MWKKRIHFLWLPDHYPNLQSSAYRQMSFG